MSRETVPIGEAALLEVLTVASLFLVAVLGTLIAYQAYRGYRRNGVESMRYLAVGLLLLTLCPFLVNVALSTAVDPRRTTLELLQNLSRLAGLVTIMYSLYGRH